MNTTTGVWMARQQYISTGASQLKPRAYIDNKINYFLLKRVADIAVSAFVIAGILSWGIPLLAILIKLDSRGPVFFLQKRVGRGGRSFTCLKLRTMVVNAAANKKQAEVNDQRITRLGHFLRKSNIDELPQFLNVLAGSMSIVGPRPHMYADCNYFSAFIPGYKFRNLVKPGITGLAQVKGYHGPSLDYDNIFKRFQLDAFYVRNAGIAMDVKILIGTMLRLSTDKVD
jgi:putative colanic acid biosynthesis UDP-glucose lipid carrier transferase